MIRTNIQTVTYRGKRVEAEEEEEEEWDYNAIVKRENNRTSHQGQIIRKFEDTKDLTRKSKDKQYNGLMKWDKRTNNDLQNNTLKTKDRSTRIPLNTEGDLMCFRMGKQFLFH